MTVIVAVISGSAARGNLPRVTRPHSLIHQYNQIRKNMMYYRFVTALLLISTLAPAQEGRFYYHPDSAAFTLPAVDRSYRFNPLSTRSRDNVIGADLVAAGQSGALSPYDNYEDALYYLLSPHARYHFNDKISATVRVSVENIREDYLYPQRQYWGDTFAGHRGAYELASIDYRDKYFSIKVGRDYLQPGVYLYENLLFSRFAYSHDQIRVSLHNSLLEISSVYLSPTATRENGRLYNRHVNAHRLSLRLPWGYIALNDVMIYGGVNQSVDWMAFNPLVFLYPYRKNKKHLDGNNLMSVELYLRGDAWFLFTEALLDDYQADREVPTDLEPPEWGLNITLGKRELFRNVLWKLNYTRVANRTFNAPDRALEKYIEKNYPIGHWLGNNFWEVKSSLVYDPGSRWNVDLTLSYLEYGDEALYAPFNKDYENYTVEQGYEENFPFGRVRSQAGLTVNSYYCFSEEWLLRGRLSYWPRNTLLANSFNAGLSVAYRMRWSLPGKP